jgi:sugar lactone lactonase YvrE
MGTQSITHPPRTRHAPFGVALLLLLFLASTLNASAQTGSVSALTVPLVLPSAIVFDAAGNLYFAETGNHVVRKLDTTGNITTIAGTGTQGFSGDGGSATAATLDSPQGVALDSANNLYIADTHNHRVRKLTASTGILTTIAGTTPGFSGDNALATAAQLNLPTALALDASNNLYLADTGNHRIRKISAAGIISTIAGTGTQGFSGDTGPALSATIDSPTGLALDASNNLYLADTHNHRIRKITAATGIISTLAGTGTLGFSGDTADSTTANLALPHGITMDPAGNLYFADTANHRIRRIDATTGIITTVAGDGTQAFAGDGGPAIAASLDSPRNAAVSPSTLLTLSDTGNQRIRQLEAAPAPATSIHTIAGLGVTTPGALTLTAPSVMAYGTGQLTATLASTKNATGAVTFLDTTNNTALGTATLVANIATLPTTTLPAGQHHITATYGGDQTHLSAQSSGLALTITPRQLNATITPTTLLYGQPIPGISGSLAGVLPQDASNLSATFTTTATTGSNAGAYSITATLTGPAAGNYALPSPAAILTIIPAPTVITLNNLIAPAGSSIALTAHVASTTSGAPTGSVTLLDGSLTLFTTPLSATGDAVFTIPSITQGDHSFTALYNGTGNFTSSASAPQLITGGTGPGANPDFTLAPTGTTTQTIPSGSSADYTFTVQLQGNMSSPITLAATGLPNLAKASFNPPIVPPGSTSSAFTLTIATPNTTASNSGALSSPITWAFLLSPIAVFSLRARNGRKTARLFVLALLSLIPLLATGCGNRISTADSLALTAKSYSITITGTATTDTGSILQHSTTVTLLLEQAQ